MGISGHSCCSALGHSLPPAHAWPVHRRSDAHRSLTAVILSLCFRGAVRPLPGGPLGTSEHLGACAGQCFYQRYPLGLQLHSHAGGGAWWDQGFPVLMLALLLIVLPPRGYLLPDWLKFPSKSLGPGPQAVWAEGQELNSSSPHSGDSFCFLPAPSVSASGCCRVHVLLPERLPGV